MLSLKRRTWYARATLPGAEWRENMTDSKSSNTLGSAVGTSSDRPSTMPSAHAALPVWNAEAWFYGDWPVGQKIRSLRRTISEGDSHQFNLLVTDIHPYVQDQIFAETQGVFGRRLIAGAFVFSAGLGLVATNCVNAFSYGYDRLRFIKPVFIGDTIYTIRTNMEKWPKVASRLTQVTAISGALLGRPDPTCCAYLSEADS